MNTPSESELAHLLTLLKPPYTQGWRAFCWDKAQKLAASDPQSYAALPEMLKAAMQSLSSSASPSAGAAESLTASPLSAATE